jgi:dihydrofolate reductase
MLTLIAAVGLEKVYTQIPRYVIGNSSGASLPWRLPRDMKFFREMTMGHVVVMGRKTWDTIPSAYKPLPGRVNIVITRDPSFRPEGVIVYSSIEDVFRHAEHQQIFAIGGQQIYEMFMSYASRIYLTRVHGRFNGDKFFPKMNWSEWRQRGSSTHYSSDSQNAYGMTFETYVPV